MSSLIANKVKTNMLLVSIKLFIVRTIFCATVFNLYNNKYLFDILLCLQIFQQPTTLVRQICIVEIFKQRQFSSHKTDCITTDLSSALTVNTISLSTVLEVEGLCSRPFKDSIAATLLFVRSYTCLYIFLSRLLLLVYLEQVRCICQCSCWSFVYPSQC